MGNGISLPRPVKDILNALGTLGFRAYAVGGCVRDSLLGKPPQDWDVCTDARPEQVKACFSKFPVLETGLSHGTVTLLLDHVPYEITTFRTESGYSDSRHPDRVTCVDSLREDLSRRDFTVNAMAYHPAEGIHDPFGGRTDLKAGRIRCVGEPGLRFQEDALRLLRAVRFASAYGFSVEPDTARAIHENRLRLRNISPERINVELQKLLCGPGAGKMLREYADLIGVFLPELTPMVGFEQHNIHHIYDVWEHTLHGVDAVEPLPVLRLAMLFHDSGKPACYTMDEKGVGHFYGHPKVSFAIAEKALARLRFDHETIREVTELVRHHDAPVTAEEKSLRRWLNRLGEQGVRRLLKIKRADAIAQALFCREERLPMLDQAEEILEQVLQKEQCFSLKDLAITGKDLLTLGLPQGPMVGAALKALLDKVIDGELPNDRERLLHAASAWMKSKNSPHGR